MTYWAHHHHDPQFFLWDIIHLPIIDRTVTPYPGQNTNPTTSHITFVPNPPRYSTPGAQPSIIFSPSPSSAEGKPSARPTLSGTKIVPSQGHTYGIE